LSLAIPKGINYPGIHWFDGKTIATTYPKVLGDFLREKKINADIHVITGSVEIAPSIGLADAIFDLVSSGSTLVTNHLKEVEVVMKSEAVLIKHPDLSAEKTAILKELLFRIESVLLADDKKYVLMNVPTENIPKIVEVLPGMKSPTVLSLAKEGWSSLHAVISEKEFWNIIGKLKELDAEGILVVPIEKMIL
jgi:ATP phosphoribosyltransferase